MAEIMERPEEDEVEVVQESLEGMEEELPEQTTEPDPDPIPEKFQGKEAKDLIRMIQESEKFAGRQSQEIGELRKAFDNLAETKFQEAPQEPEEEIDFFVDPEKAMAKAIESHPKLKEAEAVAQQYRRATAVGELKRKHPDMQEILKDEAFATWVQNSKFRTKMFQQADQGYDHEAADELFSTWKERRVAAAETAQLDKEVRSKQVKAASTGNARGSSEPTSRKTFRRADIIKLMNHDPDRYMAMEPEIRQAYIDGRVK